MCLFVCVSVYVSPYVCACTFLCVWLFVQLLSENITLTYGYFSFGYRQSIFEPKQKPGFRILIFKTENTNPGFWEIPRLPSISTSVDLDCRRCLGEKWSWLGFRFLTFVASCLTESVWIETSLYRAAFTVIYIVLAN